MKEVYKGSQLVYSSQPPFNPVLYQHGYEGVEWEQGFTVGTQGTHWLLDKSDNSLHAQVMSTASGQEAAWTTKNPVDLSNFTNLKIILDRQNPSNNIIRTGVFISSSKNNTAYGNVTYLNNTFNHYIYYQSGNATGVVLNLPLNIQGEYYISVHAVKLSPGNYTGIIKVRELLLELFNKTLFEADMINNGFEQGFKTGSGNIQIIDSNLHVSASSGGNTIVSTNKINATPYKTLKISFINNGGGVCLLALIDAKSDNIQYYNYSYSYVNNQNTTLEFDISNISGEKYVAICANYEGSGQVLINVSKVELLVE